MGGFAPEYFKYFSLLSLYFSGFEEKLDVILIFYSSIEKLYCSLASLLTFSLSFSAV